MKTDPDDYTRYLNLVRSVLQTPLECKCKHFLYINDTLPSGATARLLGDDLAVPFFLSLPIRNESVSAFLTQIERSQHGREIVAVIETPSGFTGFLFRIGPILEAINANGGTA